MQVPNLDLIVDTFIRIKELRLDAYIAQLRTEFIPEIRKLEKEGRIIWYAFLIHDHSQLGGRVPNTDKNLYIHIRLGLPEDADVAQFIKELPSHFEQPEKVFLSEISGVDVSILNGNDWAYAWKVHGEASEWILRLLEAHADDTGIHIPQIIQFLHFITNPLMIGNRCLYLNSGFLRF